MQSTCQYCRTQQIHESLCLCATSETPFHTCPFCNSNHPQHYYCESAETQLREAPLDRLPELLGWLSACRTCAQPWLSEEQASLCCSRPASLGNGRLACGVCGHSSADGNHLRNHVLRHHLGHPLLRHCVHFPSACWRVFPQTALGETLFRIHLRLTHSRS
jgi:hypothetical protein